jgi:hypothetical protein
MRTSLRSTGAISEKARPKTVPLTHILLFKFGVDFHELVNRTQGDNKEEMDEAQVCRVCVCVCVCVLPGCYSSFLFWCSIVVSLIQRQCCWWCRLIGSANWMPLPALSVRPKPRRESLLNVRLRRVLPRHLSLQHKKSSKPLWPRSRLKYVAELQVHRQVQAHTMHES